jgi:hypothetical protein
MKKTIISGKVDIQISDKLKAKCERNGQTVSEVIAQFAENYISETSSFDFAQFKEQYNNDIANIQSLLKQSVAANLNLTNAYVQQINKMFNFIIAGIKVLGHHNKSIEKWFEKMPMVSKINLAN